MMTTESATQEGVEALQPAYGARASAMAEIAQRVHAQHSEDLADFNPETGEIVKSDKTESPPEPPAQEEQQQGADKPEEHQSATEDHETIIVDGKEVKVKRDQLIEAGKRTLQKESAADRRLQEASETLRRAQAYERQTLQGRPSTDAAPDETQQPSQDAANGNGQQSTTEQRAIVRQELWLAKADEASEKFQTEFKDIVGDPLAMRLVVQLENERLAKASAEGIPLGDPWKAYESHGKSVREWLGKTKTNAPTIPEDKSERKRGTVTVVGSGARVPTPTPQKPLTTSEIIEQQRLARQGRPVQKSR